MFFLWLMKRTRLGLEVRAVTQNPSMAASMGINPDRINMLTFGLGSGIAGIAGVAIGLFAKVTSELGWAENPPSRTRHLVSNVLINEAAEPNSFEVSSAFILYRNRLERQVDIFAGERRDVLRRADNGLGFKIAKRTILLDQSTLLSNNLSIFF